MRRRLSRGLIYLCVCFAPERPSSPGRVLSLGGPRAGSGNGTGGKHSLKEGGHRGGVSSWKRVRVLQPVLHSSKEGWRVASHFRSAAVEPLSQQTEVQDAYSQAGRVSNQVRGLVCRDRSKRRILPRLHPSHSQEVPEVCFQGQSLPISGTSLRPSTLTLHFYEVCGRRVSSAAATGVRILNYIDDWLILAQSKRRAAQHRDVVLAHMKVLGLRLNPKKSVLSPLQRTTYLGVVWDSTTMQARMSPARIESILTTVRRVKEGQSLTVKQFQRLLGLMAAASNVIPIGLLYMRPLQWWLKTKGFFPRGNPLRMIKVTRRCLRALDMWRQPWFLSQGPVLGAPCRRVTLATDASLTGWGAVMSGHPARGLWRGHHLAWHINRLEMLAVFQALKYFLPDLRGHHVPTTQRWSLISTTKEVWGRVTCTGWRTRSLCGPRANSSHSEQFTYLGISMWGQTPCRDRGLCPGNGCFTPRWWNRYGECLARLRWTSSLLRRQRNVPSGTLYFIQPHCCY